MYTYNIYNFPLNPIEIHHFPLGFSPSSPQVGSHRPSNEGDEGLQVTDEFIMWLGGNSQIHHLSWKQIESKLFLAVWEQNLNPRNLLIHQSNCLLTHHPGQTWDSPEFYGGNFLAGGVWQGLATWLQGCDGMPRGTCSAAAATWPKCTVQPKRIVHPTYIQFFFTSCPLALFLPFVVEVLNNPKYANLSM